MAKSIRVKRKVVRVRMRSKFNLSLRSFVLHVIAERWCDQLRYTSSFWVLVNAMLMDTIEEDLWP